MVKKLVLSLMVMYSVIHNHATVAADEPMNKNVHELTSSQEEANDFSNVGLFRQPRFIFGVYHDIS